MTNKNNSRKKPKTRSGGFFFETIDVHRKIKQLAFLVCSISLFNSAQLMAEIDTNSEPNNQNAQLELGVGLVSQWAADYRGSKQYSVNALPLPYILYTGEIFKIDRDGIRGELFASDRYELNFSFDGSLSSNSDDNKLREGMPKLNSTFEVGPSFNINLTGENFKQGWSLRLPLRAVVAVGSNGLDYAGNIFNPRLTWRDPNFYAHWRASFNLGVLWASQKYHAYYYEVTTPFATESRSEYFTRSGYSGSYIRLGAYRQFESWRVGMSLRYDTLNGTTFENSPLVETTDYLSFSLGVTKRLWMGRAMWSE